MLFLALVAAVLVSCVAESTLLLARSRPSPDWVLTQSELTDGGSIACRWINWVYTSGFNNQAAIPCAAGHQSDGYSFISPPPTCGRLPLDWECETPIPRGDIAVLLLPVFERFFFWNQECCLFGPFPFPYSPPAKCGATPCTVTPQNKCSFQENKVFADANYDFFRSLAETVIKIWSGNNMNGAAFATLPLVQLRSTSACNLVNPPISGCYPNVAQSDNAAVAVSGVLFRTADMTPGPYTAFSSYSIFGTNYSYVWRFRIDTPGARPPK